jgi:hypothetical protein
MTYMRWYSHEIVCYTSYYPKHEVNTSTQITCVSEYHGTSVPNSPWPSLTHFFFLT